MIGAIANVVGGLIGARSAEKAKDANVAMSAADREMQKEFAQQGVRWKVEDARAAGISPLFALGAPNFNYTPTSIGVQPDNSLGQGIANAGQDISRAIHATRTGQERADEYAKLQMENARLQNDGIKLRNQYMASQLAKINQPGTGPGLPSDGLVDMQPLKKIVSSPASLSQEPDSVTDIGYSSTNIGGYSPMKSKDSTERLEDDFWGNLAWNVRNRVLPTVGMDYNPPYPAPEGNFWWYHPIRQEYLLMRKPFYRR